MVTLTIRSRLRSSSPVPTNHTLASCSSVFTSDSSGITLVLSGVKGEHGYEGPSQGAGPKYSIVTEGTLCKGQLIPGRLLGLKHTAYIQLLGEQQSA